jgi:integrase
MSASTNGRRRARGTVEELPSGSLRAKVYAGYDPLTKRRHYLSETIKPGPRARAEGEKALTRRHSLHPQRGLHARRLRWRWIGRNPIDSTESPGAVPSKPSPPTPQEAARLLEEAWKDPDCGAFVWTAMTTGARRGELCALKREDVDLDAGVIWIRRAMTRDERGNWVRHDTKTHQQRRVALDPETVEVLREYTARVDALATQLDCTIGPDGYLFTTTPDATDFLIPDTATQRYDRMAKRLGITTTLHKLRHYSATELLAAGVDIRTVAGRLGLGGRGATTLRVYAAWVSAADQRAAASLATRLPRPGRG